MLKKITPFVLFAFLCEQIAIASPLPAFSQSNPLTNSQHQIRIPSEFAIIEDSFITSTSASKMVYLIQDAHTNESAQANISSILNHLSTNQNLDLVLGEGAEGDNSLSWMRGYMNEKKARLVVDSYLRKGLINGVEHFTLTSGKNKNVLGAEDMKLYQKSLEHYSDVRERRGELNDYLTKVKSLHQFLLAKHTNAYLQDLLQLRNGYKSNHISFLDYVSLLKKHSIQNDGLEYQYPLTQKIIGLAQLEKSIDFRVAEQNLMRLTAKHGMPSNALFNGKVKNDSLLMSKSEALQLIGSIRARVGDEDFAINFPNLEKYRDYLQQLEGFDGKQLLDELVEFEAEVIRSLTLNQVEESLLLAERKIELLAKLANLNLSNDEFNEIQSFPGNHRLMTQVLGFLNRLLLETKNASEKSIFYENKMQQLLDQATEFYQLTILRDKSFVEFLNKAMSDYGNKEAALIIGGYHAEHVKHLLKKEGVSYVSVLPKITHPTDHARYERLLLSRNTNLDHNPSKFGNSQLRESSLSSISVAWNMTASRLSKENALVELSRDLNVPIGVVEAVLSGLNASRLSVSPEEAEVFKARFFRAPFWDAEYPEPLFPDYKIGRTVDSGDVEIHKSDDEWVNTVAITDDAGQVVPKGLILSAFHEVEIANSKEGKRLIDQTYEVAGQINSGIENAYQGKKLKYLIWPGMGGSIEDKYAAKAVGVMGDHVQFFGLDDVNPETLGQIYLSIFEAEAMAMRESGEKEDAQASDDEVILSALQQTVIVAQALGMTSVEPVFNVLQALIPTFDRYDELDQSIHFRKITIPGSLLDQGLTDEDGVQNIVHQLTGQSTSAGRHDYVTNGMLLPLILSGGDPYKWMKALDINTSDIQQALELANWIVESESLDLNKVVLGLPDEWQPYWKDLEWRDPSLWIKQHFEESLGKDPSKVLKIVTGRPIRASEYKDADENIDKVFLVIRIKGATNTSEQDIKTLRRKGYRVFEIDLDDGVSEELGSYTLARVMQIMTYAKYSIAHQWGMTAVDQPPVEFYKKIVSFMRDSSENYDMVLEMFRDPKYLVEDSDTGISINYAAMILNGSITQEEVDQEIELLGLDSKKTADVAGAIHRIALRKLGPKAYGEVMYSGNYTRGREAMIMREVIQNYAGKGLWGHLGLESHLDDGKGPGAGHATHAMGKQGQVLTTNILPKNHLPTHPFVEDYEGDYQDQNAYANILALAGYDVVDQELQITGHPGMALLMQIPQNDHRTRQELKSYFTRVGSIIRMTAPTGSRAAKKNKKEARYQASYLRASRLANIGFDDLFDPANATKSVVVSEDGVDPVHGIYSSKLFTGKSVLIFVRNDEDRFFLKPLITLLSKHNTVEIRDLSESLPEYTRHVHLSQLDQSENGYDYDVVVGPSGADKIESLYQELAALKEDNALNVLSYTPFSDEYGKSDIKEGITANPNLAMGLNESKLKLGMGIINLFATQVERSLYDLVFKFNSYLAAMVARYLGLGNEQVAANTFTVARMDLHGEFQVDPTPHELLTEDEAGNRREGFIPLIIKKGSQIIFASPHSDDPEISAFTLYLWALENKLHVHNTIQDASGGAVLETSLVTKDQVLDFLYQGENSSSHSKLRAFLRSWYSLSEDQKKAIEDLPEESRDEFKDHIRLRESEATRDAIANAAGVNAKEYVDIKELGLVYGRNKDLPVDEKVKLLVRHYRGIIDQHIKSGNSSPLLIGTAHPRDHHPRHRQFTELTRSAIKALTRSGPTHPEYAKYNGLDVRFLFYKAAWFGNNNAYFHYNPDEHKLENDSISKAVNFARKVFALVTGELAAVKFGLKSPSPQEMGGELAMPLQRMRVVSQPQASRLSLSLSHEASSLLPEVMRELDARKQQKVRIFGSASIELGSSLHQALQAVDEGRVIAEHSNRDMSAMRQSIGDRQNGFFPYREMMYTPGEDVPEFIRSAQHLLTKKGSVDILSGPSTIAVTSIHGVEVLIEQNTEGDWASGVLFEDKTHPEKSGFLHEDEYEKLLNSNSLSKSDAFRYMVALFGLKGLKITISSTNQIKESTGGYESSGAFLQAAGVISASLASHLGFSFTEEDLYTLLLTIAREKLNDITGGIGMIAAFMGGASRFYFPQSGVAISVPVGDPKFVETVRRYSRSVQLRVRFKDGERVHVREGHPYYLPWLEKLYLAGDSGMVERIGRMMKLAEEKEIIYRLLASVSGDEKLEEEISGYLAEKINEFTDIIVWLQNRYIQRAIEESYLDEKGSFYNDVINDAYLLEKVVELNPDQSLSLRGDQVDLYLGGNLAFYNALKQYNLSAMAQGAGGKEVFLVVIGHPKNIQRMLRNLELTPIDGESVSEVLSKIDKTSEGTQIIRGTYETGVSNSGYFLSDGFTPLGIVESDRVLGGDFSDLVFVKASRLSAISSHEELRALLINGEYAWDDVWGEYPESENSLEPEMDYMRELYGNKDTYTPEQLENAHFRRIRTLLRMFYVERKSPDQISIELNLLSEEQVGSVERQIQAARRFAASVLGITESKLLELLVSLDSGEDESLTNSLREFKKNHRRIYKKFRFSYAKTWLNARLFIRNFQKAIRKGLSDKSSSLKMLNAFVEKPSGEFQDAYGGFDFGGTNFRILLSILLPNQTIQPAILEVTIPDDLVAASDADSRQLQDFLSQQIVEKMQILRDKLDVQGQIKVGFTFSFPTRQVSIDEGTLIHTVKGFSFSGMGETQLPEGGVEPGREMVSWLKEGLDRADEGHDIEIVAIVNDTVGTLAIRGTVSLIAGTGTNTAAWIPVIQADGTIKYIAYNFESGGFGDFSILGKTFIRNGWDEWLDKYIDPEMVGSQIFEKMSSGKFLGELARGVLLEMIDGNPGERQIFNHVPNSTLRGRDSMIWRPHGIKTEDLSVIWNDSTSDMRGVKRVLEKWGINPQQVAEEDLRALRALSDLIFRRSAFLMASKTSAIIKHIDPRNISDHEVAVDGSLYEFNPMFQEEMRRIYRMIFGQNKAPDITLTRDGSGIGAIAIAASVSTSASRLSSSIADQEDVSNLISTSDTSMSSSSLSTDRSLTYDLAQYFDTLSGEFHGDLEFFLLQSAYEQNIFNPESNQATHKLPMNQRIFVEDSTSLISFTYDVEEDRNSLWIEFEGLSNELDAIEIQDPLSRLRWHKQVRNTTDEDRDRALIQGLNLLRNMRQEVFESRFSSIAPTHPLNPDILIPINLQGFSSENLESDDEFLSEIEDLIYNGIARQAEVLDQNKVQFVFYNKGSLSKTRSILFDRILDKAHEAASDENIDLPKIQVKDRVLDNQSQSYVVELFSPEASKPIQQNQKTIYIPTGKFSGAITDWSLMIRIGIMGIQVLAPDQIGDDLEFNRLGEEGSGDAQSFYQLFNQFVDNPFGSKEAFVTYLSGKDPHLWTLHLFKKLSYVSIDQKISAARFSMRTRISA